MAEDVGKLLRHQHSDLIHGTAKLQVAQVEAWGEGMAAVLVVSQLILWRKVLLDGASPCSRALSCPRIRHPAGRREVAERAQSSTARMNPAPA